MIRRSPAEFYLKYLISHPDCYENLQICRMAGELGLDYLGEWYLTELRERCIPPKNFRPNAEPPDLRSSKFLRRERLEYAYAPDKAMLEAFDLLARPRLREVVETMLVAGAPVNAVHYTLRERTGFVCLELAVSRYAHYFWNLSLLDSNDVRTLLFYRADGSHTTPPAQIHGQQSALKKTMYSDPRLVAARAPTSQWSAAIAQMAIGVLPKKIDVAKLAADVKAISLLRTYEAVSAGGMSGAQMGQGFSAIVESMQRVEKEVRDPENELREGLRRVALSSAKTEVPSLKQLTAGQHTTNLHPEPTPEEDDTISDGQPA